MIRFALHAFYFATAVVLGAITIAAMTHALMFSAIGGAGVAQ